MPDKNGSPTDSEVNDALAVLRRDYYADVRGLADAFREAKAYAKMHGKSFDPSDALHEIVDGSQRVIYTYQAKIGLLCTDNADAYEEETGEPPSSVETAMFMALRRDVEESLGDDYSEIEEDEMRHTACRFCGLDIEGPDDDGDWMDRGHNWLCANTEDVYHRPADGEET